MEIPPGFDRRICPGEVVLAKEYALWIEAVTYGMVWKIHKSYGTNGI